MLFYNSQNDVSWHILVVVKLSYIYCDSEWKVAILKAMGGPGRVWVEKKRFGSFAPVRENCEAAWCVYTVYANILMSYYV